MKNKELIIVLGPTAVGKSNYAVELALQHNSPIISCDSRQIYKEMKIGTAPPSPEMLAKIQHYFIFSHSIHALYTAGKYELEALEILNGLFETHDTLVMVGGSGLYIDALCYGLDDFPDADDTIRNTLAGRLEKEGIESLRAELQIVDEEAYRTMDIANPRRIMRALEVFLMTGKKYSSYKSNHTKERNFKITKIGLNRNREELYERINLRVDQMVEEGLVEEARDLYQYRHLTALNTVGYRELFDYFANTISLEKAIELIKRNSRRYAKRQLTYWRRDENIRWIGI